MISDDKLLVLVRRGSLNKRVILRGGEVPHPNYFSDKQIGMGSSDREGWVFIDQMRHADRPYFEAQSAEHYEDGLYELVGPRAPSNPDKLSYHRLIPIEESVFAV